MRIDRLLSITILMLNRDRVTAKELSEKFEVSVRTIYRDLDALLLAGIPVMSYQGNEGGYGLVENYKINKQLLSLNEMLSILSSLQSINISLEDEQYDSAMEKIKSLVPGDKKEEISRQMEQIIIDFIPWDGNLRQKDNLSLVHKSIVASKIIEFTYTNNKGIKKRRKVEPMTLFFRGYGWYLFAYCLLRNDYRIFRLARIRNISTLSSLYTRRNRSYKDFSSPEFDKGEKIELVIKFSKEIQPWVEDAFDDSDIKDTSETHFIVTTEINEDNWIYPWILSYGEHAEILKPKSVRDKIKEISKKIHTKYQT
ncbi:MAG: YafY family protein [Acidobacteriota bacterium]